METTTEQKQSFGEIIKGDVPVLVDFFAEWCGPCKMMKPILEELHRKMGEKLKILKIDIERSPGVAEKLQIHSVPTLMLFQNGKTLWRQSGVMQVSHLEGVIAQYATNHQ